MLTQWAHSVAEHAAAALEIFGIVLIIVMVVVATATAVATALQKKDRGDVFHVYRLELSRGILLGLEFLVGADIINTVAVDLSYHSLGVLAVIVLLRTFLSFTLEVEISGRWPWQRDTQRL